MPVFIVFVVVSAYSFRRIPQSSRTHTHTPMFFVLYAWRNPSYFRISFIAPCLFIRFDSFLNVFFVYMYPAGKGGASRSTDVSRTRRENSDENSSLPLAYLCYLCASEQTGFFLVLPRPVNSLLNKKTSSDESN